MLCLSMCDFLIFIEGGSELFWDDRVVFSDDVVGGVLIVDFVNNKVLW